MQDHVLATLLQDFNSVAVLADGSFVETLDHIRGELPAIRSDRFVLIGGQRETPHGFRTYADFTAGASKDNPVDAGLTDVSDASGNRRHSQARRLRAGAMPRV